MKKPISLLSPPVVAIRGGAGAAMRTTVEPKDFEKRKKKIRTDSENESWVLKLLFSVSLFLSFLQHFY